jgi:hypothetical protein
MNDGKLNDSHLAIIETRANIAREYMNGPGGPQFPEAGLDYEATIKMVLDDVPDMRRHIDIQDHQIAGLTGALRAVKDELQLLIDGAKGRGYFLPSPGISNMEAIVYAIDQALERNGATYE